MIYKDDYTLPKECLEQLAEKGSERLPELVRARINEVLQIE